MVIASHLCYEIEKGLSWWFCKCMCGYACIICGYVCLWVVIRGYSMLYSGGSRGGVPFERLPSCVLSKPAQT